MTTGPTTETGGGATRRRPPSIEPGQVLAGRYEVRRLLGRGGMGEVWLAFDLKLRLDVALKDLAFVGDRNAEMVRREVRAALGVISPNVCRVYDLVEANGRELLAMEYVDGRTLRQLLDERGPLPMNDAQPIASQFLAGLEAIHGAHLVHRDLKPDNVMITRAGRVVIMDFGLAREVDASRPSFAGTPAYMAPEQIAGDRVDARTDVFSAGLVLAEMITPRSPDNIFTGVRRGPPDSPWSGVLRKAIATERAARFDSARDLARALDDIALRAGTGEEKQPYPGLSAFNTQQSAYFFGREAEVESVLRKIERYSWTALIGPSGAGKTSLIKAGVLPALPPSWGTLLIRPGSSPFVALGESLSSQLAGDAEALREMVRIHESDGAVAVLRRWKNKFDEALLIVDQFEELFTLNPFEVQTRFAEVLGRASTDAGIRIVISIRDDFFFHCHQQPPLAPLFLDVTPLDSPAGGALRRALVQPALSCGYKFEDEAIVEDMLSTIGNGRGTLPLLAFAVAKLWDNRDRDNGLLTRRAYEEIGGVSGALARYAETVLDQIDDGDIVREIFRNLTTGKGTRAARTTEEVLSVFTEAERARAHRAITMLVNARLLSSFEEGEQAQIEIVHESLMTAWPTLARWQTQDADAAQFRDHLRQSAQVWEERGQPADLLWTGTPFREFRLWRERYAGGLSSTEEAFAAAMTAAATRRRHVRRMTAATFGVVLIAVAATMTLLWRNSEIARAKAVASENVSRAQSRRAEAEKLLALSETELERFPAGALAYAIKSLEFADTPEARERIVSILWSAPVSRFIQLPFSTLLNFDFSPDGRLMATASPLTDDFLFHDDGRPKVRLDNPPGYATPFFTGDGKFVVISKPLAARILSAENGNFLRELPVGHHPFFDVRDTNIIAAGDPQSVVYRADGRVWPSSKQNAQHWTVSSWPVDGGPSAILGQVDSLELQDIHPVTGALLFRDHSLFRQPLAAQSRVAKIRDLDASPSGARFNRDGDAVAIEYESHIDIVDLPTGHIVRRLQPGISGLFNIGSRFDRSGSRLFAAESNTNSLVMRVWDRNAPEASEPLTFGLSREFIRITDAGFDPSGNWLVTATTAGTLAFSAMGQRHPLIFHSALAEQVGFLPDGNTVAVCGGTGVFLIPLRGSTHTKTLPWPELCAGMEVERDGSHFVIGQAQGMHLTSILDGTDRSLMTSDENPVGMTFDPNTGRVAFHVHNMAEPGKRRIVVVDLRTGNERSFPVPVVKNGPTIIHMAFAADGTLYTDGPLGLRTWDIARGTSRLVPGVPEKFAVMTMSGDRRLMLAAIGDGQIMSTVTGNLTLFDLERDERKPITVYGSQFVALALNEHGDVMAVSDPKGVIRVGRTDGGQPHLLGGSRTPAHSISLSADGRQLVSGGADVRVWPVPDLAATPFHALPHAELLRRLAALTNLRAQRDASTSSGYKLVIGPFPGWKDLPTW